MNYNNENIMEIVREKPGKIESIDKEDNWERNSNKR
jgi:hypothetical protein